MTSEISTRARLEIARSFLSLALEEMVQGYDLGDYRRIRTSAEHGWLAALSALDCAMQMAGQIPEPGPMRQASMHRFLEKAARQDLSKQLAVFHDQLHGRIYYCGDIPGRNSMGFALEEVAGFIETLGQPL